ncbi:MAG: TerB family tellurite resistance protein [Kiritimatiellia bacterium]
MGWIGSVAGFVLGRQYGGVLGGLAGMVLGSLAEGWVRSANARESPARANANRTSLEREVVFLTAIGAMLAKLSKADNHIDQTEIDAGERAFVRLGLSPEKREFCIRAFRSAKNDEHSIFEYAAAFASVEPDVDMRELVYDILWDVACADGVVTPEERDILGRIVGPLRLRASIYAEEAARRIHGGGQGRHTAGGPSQEAAPDPYEVIGVARSASNDEIRRAYREKAKKFHPDVLRAQGLPEEMLARANGQMARINAAWEQIKHERGL